jgi:hypothetical protein
MARIKGNGGPSLGIEAPLFSGAASSQAVDANAGRTKLGVGIGDIAEAFNTANTRADLMTAKADLHADLLAARDSLNDEHDPETLKPKWNQVAGEILKKYQEKYKDNDNISTSLNAFFTERKAVEDVDVNKLYRSKTIDRGKASGMQNADVLLSTLNTASPAKDYDWALQLHDDDVQDKFETGIYSAEEAERRRLTFKAAVDKMREENLEEQRLNGVHATLAKTFGKNPNGAVSYLENPDNWGALGIGHKDALHFITVFDQQATRAKRRADEARAAGERSELHAYWQAVNSGDLDKAGTILTKARSIPGDKLYAMQQALTKDKWDDDPAVVAATVRGIWGGQITDPSQLTPKMGNGLSVKTTQALRTDIEKVNKEAPEFPGAMNFYDNALKRYSMVFDKDSPMHEQQGKFAATLAYQAKQRKIGPFDPRMDGLADELLKTVDKPWYKFGSETNFEKQFNEQTLPIPKPGDSPLPKSVAAQSSGPQGLAARIPAQEYQEIKAALAQARKRSTDDDIYAVWLANKGRK